jgi:GT2 family glycosyltransferase
VNPVPRPDRAESNLRADARQPIGVLERPNGGGALLVDEHVEVRGWVWAGAGPVQIEAHLDERQATPLAGNLPRPDLRGLFADAGGAPGCGYMGFVSSAGLERGPHVLTVRASRRGQTLLRWRREIVLDEPDARYTTWYARLPAHLDSAAAGPAARMAQVTWYVRPGSGDGGALAASLAAARACGATAQALTTGTALAACSTPYFGVLDAGDLLTPDGVAMLERVLERRPDIEALYADHDHLDAAGRRVDPVLKPGWSPLLAAEPLLWAKAWVLPRRLVETLNAEALLVGGAQGQVALAALLRAPGRRVHHLPWVLTSEARPRPTTDRSALAPPPARVSVVIPTCMADPDMLARCLDGLRNVPAQVQIEIVVVLNNLVGTTPAQAEAALSRWPARVLHHPGRFNWSALSNLGARHATGDWLLFLNDDVEPLRGDWLGALLNAAALPGVGCAGAVLRYPDGTLQHAGVWISGRDGLVGRHSFRHKTGTERRVQRWLAIDREQSAVTGACLLTPRRVFQAAGGFDVGLPVVFNDVDYCLRLRQVGWRSVVAAGAELMHHESVSRMGVPEHEDHVRFSRRWADLLPPDDPHRHPCLAADSDDWLLDPLLLPPYNARP